MTYKEPSIFNSYQLKLVSIIREDRDYWLKRDESGNLTRGFELWVECIDRFFVPLGPVKKQLLSVQVPTQDTLIRRFRQIVEKDEIDEIINEIDVKEKQGQIF